MGNSCINLLCFEHNTQIYIKHNILQRNILQYKFIETRKII